MNYGKTTAAIFEDVFVEKEDICAVTFGYHLFVAGLFYQNQLEAYGAKVIPLGPGESERTVKLINDCRATVLVSNPTFAMKLAGMGIPSVRLLFVGGEPFTSVSGYAFLITAGGKRSLSEDGRMPAVRCWAPMGAHFWCFT